MKKKYLVYGLGLTGISAVKTLSSLGEDVCIYVDKSKDELKNELEKLDGYNYKLIEKLSKENLEDIDIMVKSPGIPMYNENVEKALKNNVEIISDLELAYRLFPNKKFIALTGTNGKTTTTSLLTEIFNISGKKAKFVGNIGVGMLWEMYNSDDDEYFIIECSSFQLESVNTFRTKIAGLINITPDHIDWHENMENYIKAKKNIFKFQKNDDTIVVNVDDEITDEIIKDIKSNILLTSKSKILESGVYLDNGIIKYSKDNTLYEIIEVSDLNILGTHNIENTLIAIGMAISEGIDLEDIRKACKIFSGVEHRLEYVKEYKKIKFYNDSKGTNVDASIKAVLSFDSPIILIAGGYDKKVELDSFFEILTGRVKSIILMGQTKDKFKAKAIEYKIPVIHTVKNMEEAVSIAVKDASQGDVILLSPASASWGMYDNFEIRGEHFKNIVNNLGD